MANPTLRALPWATLCVVAAAVLSHPLIDLEVYLRAARETLVGLSPYAAERRRPISTALACAWVVAMAGTIWLVPREGAWAQAFANPYLVLGCLTLAALTRPAKAASERSASRRRSPRLLGRERDRVGAHGRGEGVVVPEVRDGLDELPVGPPLPVVVDVEAR